MEASKNLQTPPNFMKDDNVSQECKNVISCLPSEKDFMGKNICNYQGSWYYPNTVQAILNFQKHFRPRDTDVILASFTKSGTTWLKALAFSVLHRDKYAANLGSHPLLSDNPHNLVRFLEMDLYDNNQRPDLKDLPSPRLFATHRPFQTLHDSLRDSPCKVVYVCRNIKDVLVSRWHFRSKLVSKELYSNNSLEYMFDEFITGAYLFGPFPDQVLSYWKASLVAKEIVEAFVCFEFFILHLMAVFVSIHRPYATLLISENPNPPKLYQNLSNCRLSCHRLPRKTKQQLRCLSAKSTPSNPDPESPQGRSFSIFNLGFFLCLQFGFILTCAMQLFGWGSDGEELESVGVKAALAMLRFYKREISPVLPRSCRYVPTCSEYSMEAYKKYGVLKGTVLTTWRLCRCNPLGSSGFDPPIWFGESRIKPQEDVEEKEDNYGVED
ncbi:unnamed protein product [Thlaspi arvense]|uniref:Sulfotransferase n=1 Tax=Thlaspi arvense TaxID=13288 RepID=A0AAU9S4R4_THLAR|nr:unnamed protein product [Thlaspi arvense]